MAPDTTLYLFSDGVFEIDTQAGTRWDLEDLLPTLKKALADDTVVIIDCPVDYAENMLLTGKLKDMKSPL